MISFLPLVIREAENEGFVLPLTPMNLGSLSLTRRVVNTSTALSQGMGLVNAVVSTAALPALFTVPSDVRKVRTTLACPGFAGKTMMGTFPMTGSVGKCGIQQ